MQLITLRSPPVSALWSGALSKQHMFVVMRASCSADINKGGLSSQMVVMSEEICIHRRRLEEPSKTRLPATHDSNMLKASGYNHLQLLYCYIVILGLSIECLHFVLGQ